MKFENFGDEPEVWIVDEAGWKFLDRDEVAALKSALEGWIHECERSGQELTDPDDIEFHRLGVQCWKDILAKFGPPTQIRLFKEDE